MKLSIFFIFSVVVVNSLFCDAKPKSKPTITTLTTKATTSSSPPGGCGYMVARETSMYSNINLENLDPLGKSNKAGSKVSDYARHHIIPFSTIKNFFNLVLSDPRTQIETCIVMNKIMIELISENMIAEYINEPTGKDNFIVRLLQSKNVKGIESMTKQSRSPEEITKHILQFFTWFPGNIFIGPKPQLRGDDPEDKFEESARYIIGEAHYNILKEMNTLMVDYIKKCKLVSVVEGYAMVNKVVELFSKLLPYPVTPYDPNNWDYKYNKNNIKKEYLKPNPKNKPVLRQYEINTGCTFDYIYHSTLSEVRKICISSDASCGCQLSKIKMIKL